MLWFTIFFLVILKIPAAYLGYVIWWAVKDPPEPGTDLAYDRALPGGEDGGGPVWHPSSGRRWVPGPPSWAAWLSREASAARPRSVPGLRRL